MESIRIQRQPEYQPRYKKKSSSLKKKISTSKKKSAPKSTAKSTPKSNKKSDSHKKTAGPRNIDVKKKQPLKTGARKILK